MYHAIVFLPLIGFLIAGLFGNQIGAKASEYITSGLLIVAAILSWIAFFSVGFGHEAEVFRIPVMTFIESGNLSVDWALRIDTLTVVMLVVVNTVSALVHVYSIGYMHHDPNRPRFFAYLSLFTFAMLALVTADNLVQMFFGWEGVGLASYLLIGFWYKKPSANAAAMKAFIVNRVGDFGFALGIFGVFVLFSSINFTTIFASAAEYLPADAGHGEAAATGEVVLNFLGYQLDKAHAMTVVCLLLFMGAMGKSAQFLLHTWLPDAMEGPTPVSALIHAATMVTAGVFMVARLSPLFELSQTALTFVTFIGATTAFFAATVGLVQNDIKRVIAYSTCSQLGYMFVALGVGAYGAGIFHLFTHAFFKALLFLGAGSVIHAVSDEQDMRRMGGLARHIPMTYWMMIVGTIALTGLGIPGTFIGTAGFFSKDIIIESSYAGQNAASGYAFGLLVIAALFTSFYSWRLIFMTFHGKPRASADVMHHVHESPYVMLVPLFVLAAGALLAGVIFEGWFFGHEYAEFWKGALYTGPHNEVLEEFHHSPLWVKWSPFVVMALGFVLAWYMYIRSPETPKELARQHSGLYKFLLNKWYFDEFYDFLFVKPAMRLGRFLWKRGDGTVIDGLGPDGVSARVIDVTNRVVKLQTGYLYHYAFAMLIGVAALVTWMMLGEFILMTDWPILSTVTFIPLVGAALILLIRDDSDIARRNIRNVSLLTTVMTFILSLGIWIYFDNANPGFQFVEKSAWLGSGISYHMGVDGISMLFVILTTFLMPICILASWQSVEKRVKEYMIAFLVLETLMIGVFCALDLVLFYVFFEAGLIPMFLIIGVWGGKRRVYASFKFFLYTLLGSVLMLLAMMAMYWQAGTTDITELLTHDFPVSMQTWLWLAFFASFAVKMPMWPVHTWLPDAHVEAPTAGSVILAAILLKMGGYGFLRFSLPMFPEASADLAPFVFALSVIAIVYTSLVALMQEDIKKLIAYSSVAHMGYVTMGIFAMNQNGVQGAIFQMLSHGLVSGALFLCVGVVYDRMHTREIAAYGGLVNNMPKYAVAFMVFTMANVGLPGTSGFIGEFLTLLGVFQVNTWVALFATLGVILSAAYALWLYRRVIFGVLEKESLKSLLDLSGREKAILYPLIVLTIFFGVYPAPIFNATAASVDALIQSITVSLDAAGQVAQAAVN